MAARRRPHRHRVGRKTRPAERTARIPASADDAHAGAGRLAEPQRALELRDSPDGRDARKIRRADSGAVRRGVEPLRGRQASGRPERTLVQPHLHDLPEMERQTRAAALRRSGLESRRLGERRLRGNAHRRLHAVRIRHHGGAQEGRQRAEGTRMGPHRRGLPAPRQAGEPSRRHLVHPRERHLADGMARSRAAAVHQEHPNHARPRPQTVSRGDGRLRRAAGRRDRSASLRQRHEGSRGPCAQRCARGAERGGA